MNDVTNLVKQHEAGFAGLRHLYPKDLLRKGILWPTIASTILIVFLLATKADSQKMLTSITEATISVMPSLLGFLLGGYTILISFSNNKLLGNLTKIPKNSNISVFQKVSCIFALTILVQSITLLFALITRFSMLIDIKIPNNYSWFLTLFRYIDYGVSYLLLTMLFYTIFAFKDIIVNIFSLTQVFHLTIVISQDEEELDSVATKA